MRPAETPGWDEDRLVAPVGVRHIRLRERATLFCERDQQLFGLNDSADAVWQVLAGRSASEAVDALRAEAGAAAAAALNDHVREAATLWIENGLLVPEPVLSRADLRPFAERRLRIDDLSLRLTFHGDADPAAVDEVFGQFAHNAGAPALRVAVVGRHGWTFLLEDGRPVGAADGRGWIPLLKARLTDRYANHPRRGFLAHAALLAKDDQGLMLCGAPGAGKTTLTTALARNGYDYRSDDIARFSVDSLVTGVPFSPAVKAGAWALLEPLAPELAETPAYLRGDGQAVRYLPVASAERPPLPLGAVVLLARQEGAQARLERLEPLDALTTILESGYSSRRSMDGDMLEAAAVAVEAAGVHRLVYGDLRGAMRALEDVF